MRLQTTVMTVEVAAAELEAAKQQAAGIERRIAGGDVELSLADLSTARDGVEFAQLRHTGAMAAEAKRAEGQRRKDLLLIQDRIGKTAKLPPEIEARREAAEKVIRSWFMLVREYNETLTSIRHDLRAGGFLADTMPGPVEGLPCSEGPTVSVGSVSADGLPSPKESATNLVGRLLGEHFAASMGAGR